MSLNSQRASAQFLGLWACGQTEDILFMVRFEESGNVQHFRIDDSTAVRVLQASVTTLRELGLNVGVVVTSDLDAAEADDLLESEILTNAFGPPDQPPGSLAVEIACPTLETFEETPLYNLIAVEPAMYVDEHFEESQGLAFRFKLEEPCAQAPVEYPLFPLGDASQFIASLIEGVTQLGYELDLAEEDPDGADSERPFDEGDFDYPMD